MYNKILVPLDGSELAECVLPHLKSIAGGCSVQNVVFLRVWESFNPPAGYDDGGAVNFTDADRKRIESDRKSEAESYLKQIISREKYKGVNVQSVVMKGKPADIIADYAKKSDADLIIAATHGRSGVSRWVWGSVADRILRSSCVPVFMVRAPGCIPGI